MTFGSWSWLMRRSAQVLPTYGLLWHCRSHTVRIDVLSYEPWSKLLTYSIVALQQRPSITQHVGEL